MTSSSTSVMSPEDESGINEYQILSATAEGSPLAYIQVTRPLALYPAYVAISQTTLGVKSMSLLQGILGHPRWNLKILN